MLLELLEIIARLGHGFAFDLLGHHGSGGLGNGAAGALKADVADDAVLQLEKNGEVIAAQRVVRPRPGGWRPARARKLRGCGCDPESPPGKVRLNRRRTWRQGATFPGLSNRSVSMWSRCARTGSSGMRSTTSLAKARIMMLPGLVQRRCRASADKKAPPRSICPTVAPWVHLTSSAKISNCGLVSMTASSERSRLRLVCLALVFWASWRTKIFPLKTPWARPAKMP